MRDNNWFSVEDYNVALKKLQLSPQEASNKPQQVPTSNRIKKLPGKAVSIWCHMRFFLFIVSQNGWVQDSEDDVLKLALLLTEITHRITAEKFQAYEIDRLEELIIEFLDLRKIILEQNPILGTPKPKHHYLCHYSDSIRKFGPP